MSYIVKQDGTRVGRKKFDTYEKARSYTRKLLRKSNNLPAYYDKGWLRYNNPSIGDYGYSIQRVSH